MRSNYSSSQVSQRELNSFSQLKQTLLQQRQKEDLSRQSPRFNSNHHKAASTQIVKGNENGESYFEHSMLVKGAKAKNQQLQQSTLFKTGEPPLPNSVIRQADDYSGAADEYTPNKVCQPPNQTDYSNKNRNQEE